MFTFYYCVQFIGDYVTNECHTSAYMSLRCNVSCNDSGHTILVFKRVVYLSFR